MRAVNGCTWWIKDGCGRIVETARNEHTVVNLLWTPDDEEALTPPQMMQLFWTALAVELFVICFQYNGPMGEEPPTGGGRRGGAAAASLLTDDANALGVSTFAISPVTALTQGVIASGICIGVLSFLAYVFAWGNNRHRRVDEGGWLYRTRQLHRGLRRSLRKRRRRLRRWYIRRTNRMLAAWEEEQMRKQEESEAWAEAAESERKEREDRAPPGMEYVTKRQMSFIGKLCCLFFPGIGLLAFCLCIEKRRVLVPREGDDGDFIGLGLVADADDDEDPGPGAGEAAPTKKVALAEKGAEIAAELSVADSLPTGPAAEAAVGVLQSNYRRKQAQRDFVRKAAENQQALVLEEATERLQGAYRGLQSRREVRSLRAVIRLQRATRRHAAATSAEPFTMPSSPDLPARGGGAAASESSGLVVSDPSSACSPEGGFTFSRIRPVTLNTGAAPATPPPSPPTAGALQQVLPRGAATLSPSFFPSVPPSPGADEPACAPVSTASPLRMSLKERLEKASALESRGASAKGQAGQGAASFKRNRTLLRMPTARELAVRAFTPGKSEFLSKSLAEVAIEARIKQKIDEIDWRSDREFFVRRTIAWVFNLFVFVFSLFVSLIYALKFGEYTISKTLISWAIAYGWTFTIVEPFQVVFLAFSPCLFNEDHRCGRCMVRCRTVYNELCAP